MSECASELHQVHDVAKRALQSNEATIATSTAMLVCGELCAVGYTPADVGCCSAAAGVCVCVCVGRVQSCNSAVRRCVSWLPLSSSKQLRHTPLRWLQLMTWYQTFHAASCCCCCCCCCIKTLLRNVTGWHGQRGRQQTGRAWWSGLAVRGRCGAEAKWRSLHTGGTSHCSCGRVRGHREQQARSCEPMLCGVLHGASFEGTRCVPLCLRFALWSLAACCNSCRHSMTRR